MNINFVERDTAVLHEAEVEPAQGAVLAVVADGAIPAPAEAARDRSGLVRRVDHLRRGREEAFQIGAQLGVAGDAGGGVVVLVHRVGGVEAEQGVDILGALGGEPVCVEPGDVKAHAGASPRTRARWASVKISAGAFSGPAMMATPCRPSIGSAALRS